MIEIWKATGMDMDNVEFLWASEEVCMWVCMSARVETLTLPKVAVAVVAGAAVLLRRKVDKPACYVCSVLLVPFPMTPDEH